MRLPISTRWRFATPATVEPAQRADWLVLRALSCYVTDQNAEALEALRLAVSIYHELGDTVSEGYA